MRIIIQTFHHFISVFNSGCFPTLLDLCNHANSSVSLVATSTLCLLAQCPSNHHIFIAQQGALNTLLMKISKTADEQVTFQKCFL